MWRVMNGDIVVIKMCIKFMEIKSCEAYVLNLLNINPTPLLNLLSIFFLLSPRQHVKHV